MPVSREKRRFVAVDILLIALAILPLLGAMVLRVLFNAVSDSIDITGSVVFFTLPTPIQELPITESQVNAWAVILTIFWLCLYLTHGIAAKPVTRRQHLAEWIVEKTEGLVHTNMDPHFANWAPFIAAILGLSAFSSLVSLIGLHTPTSDINVIGGWALLVFVLITVYKFKCGPLHYLGSFCQPALLTPMNIISEFATPVSMTFRHYGNVLSGSVIAVLIARLLQVLSNLILGWLPGVLGDIPFLQIGLPAILSVYFDLFSGCLQAFIFAMLTMLYVSGAFPADDYAARRAKRLQKARERASK